MDVGGWLRSLGLGQYGANFRDNKIDADVLPQLTADDLKDLGVSAVGDRRRLLAAIAALSVETPSASVAPSSPKPRPARGFRISAERRPITVMFCDLVGSTSLVAKLDAEDWRNLVNDYLDEASAAVTGLGGHALKKLGDGLMALFGYPTMAVSRDARRYRSRFGRHCRPHRRASVRSATHRGSERLLKRLESLRRRTATCGATYAFSRRPLSRAYRPFIGPI